MGNTTSRPPTPPKPLTDVPWRDETDWSAEDEKRLIQEIEKIKPKVKPTLLFVGPVGAGKSAFINSALSIGKGHVVGIAGTGSATKSYTTVNESYTEKSLLKNFRMRDCMGIERGQNEGFHVDDIVYLVKGHVMDNYTYNPVKPIDENDRYFRKKPTQEDRAYCIVFVVSAQDVHDGIPDSYRKKIASLQDKIKTLGVTPVLLLTKADRLCKEVERDIRNLFRSVKVQKAVKLASEVFSIPISQIHPVVNYAVRIELDTKTNIPLLLALKQMMHFAGDLVERQGDKDCCVS